MEVSKSGEETTVIVCYDDFTPFKRLRTEIDGDQHFLFNQLRNQFVEMRSITLEFLYIWDLLELLPQLAKDKVNTFILDFSLNDRSDEEKLAEYAKTFSLPRVSIFGYALKKVFHPFLQKDFDSHLWVAGKDAEKFGLPVFTSVLRSAEMTETTDESECN